MGDVSVNHKEGIERGWNGSRGVNVGMGLGRKLGTDSLRKLQEEGS